MKNRLESFAILLVGLLSLSVVYFIVQYSLVEDENTIDDVPYEVPQKKKEVNKSDYLQNLEGYKDVDIKVDATKETHTNTVVVKSELRNDELEKAVDDKAKSSYMQNLENYKDKAKEEKSDATEPVDSTEGEPEKLDQEEVTDEIGQAIDAALDDI